MSGMECRVSATEARVRFGELLDGVTARHDVVFVERAGKEVAVVVSVEDWEAACASRSNKWTRASAMLRSCMSGCGRRGRSSGYRTSMWRRPSVPDGMTGPSSFTVGCVDASLVVRILDADPTVMPVWERLVQSDGDLIALTLLHYEVATVLHKQ